MTIKRFDSLKAIGDFAQNLLSILGLLGIIWAIFQYWDKPFQNIKPADIGVKPFHAIVSLNKYKYSNGSKANLRFLGLEIKNEKDVSDLRIKLCNINFIDHWELCSDSITPEDQKTMLESLPVGNINSRDIFINFPRIMAKSETNIYLYAITTSDFDPSSEWFFASSSTSDIWHGIFSMQMFVREKTVEFTGPTFYKVFFWGGTIPLLVYLAYRRTRNKRRSIKNAAAKPAEPLKAE